MEHSQTNDKSFDPFKYPGIKELFSTLIDSLFEESGRGAILIATAHVEEHLTALLEAVFPEDMSNNSKKELLSYPSPLTSFASKMKIAYAFRLITKNLYDCLNALRNVRNDAAHSSSKFELHTLNEKLKRIYNFGPGISDFIRTVSQKALLHNKMDRIQQILDESSLDAADKQKIVDNLFKDEQRMESLERQVPFWELVYGLTFLCAMIADQKERLTTLTRNIHSLTDFIQIRKNLLTEIAE